MFFRKQIAELVKKFNLDFYFASNYHKLKEWCAKNPDSWPSSQSKDVEEKKLGTWCSSRRKDYKKNILSVERIEALNAINFSWEPIEEEFQNNLARLKEWRKQNPDSWPSSESKDIEESKLGRWCSKKRTDYKINTLSAERIKILNAINFPWDLREEEFQNNLARLKEWRKQNRDSWPSSRSKDIEESKLGTWCHVRRQYYKKNTLSVERIEALNAINFPWNPIEEEFQNNLARLKEWRKQNRDSWPSSRSKDIEESKLGIWCEVRRKDYKKNILSVERIEAFNAINFPWDLREEEFQNNLARLKEWRKQNPDSWPSSGSKDIEEKKLGIWCSTRRTDYKINILSVERIEALNAINFPWSLKNSPENIDISKLKTSENNGNILPNLSKNKKTDSKKQKIIYQQYADLINRSAFGGLLWNLKYGEKINKQGSNNTKQRAVNLTRNFYSGGLGYLLNTFLDNGLLHIAEYAPSKGTTFSIYKSNPEDDGSLKGKIARLIKYLNSEMVQADKRSQYIKNEAEKLLEQILINLPDENTLDQEEANRIAYLLKKEHYYLNSWLITKFLMNNVQRVWLFNTAVKTFEIFNKELSILLRTAEENINPKQLQLVHLLQDELLTYLYVYHNYLELKINNGQYAEDLEIIDLFVEDYYARYFEEQDFNADEYFNTIRQRRDDFQELVTKYLTKLLKK